jgi:hypothetical protein
MKFMLERCMAYLVVFSISLGSPSFVIGQTTGGSAAPTAQTAAKPAPSPDDPWPRVVTYQGATVSIYEPQIENWKGNQLSARSAVKVKTARAQSTDYGVIWFTAQTEVDKVNRVVTLVNFIITKQNFPTAANSGYNPSTGNRYAGGGGTVGNAYTGNYASGVHGMNYNQSTGVVRGGAAGTYGNAYTGQSVSGSHGFAYNTNEYGRPVH